MQSSFPLIDVFAGPGGLNEGFSRLGESEGAPIFSTVASFEMETSACRTLTLRGTFRHLLRTSGVPESYYQFIRGEIDEAEFRSDANVAKAWLVAESHVQQVELGPESRDISDTAIRSALDGAGVTGMESAWALIGGPPCQAYSLAGRSRRTNDVDFENDKKHFLYEEYLHILRTFAPPVFVMENVKGLLSSTHSGAGMFSRIKADLEAPMPGLEYEIHSLTVDGDLANIQPTDYIIKAEKYGVPQRRHRVILLGVRRGFFDEGFKVGKLLEASGPVTVADALAGMPKLRSGISPARNDDAAAWLEIRDEAAVAAGQSATASPRLSNRGGKSLLRTRDLKDPYSEWLLDPNLSHVVQHETRGHMKEDLKRYWFSATWAREHGHSPSLRNFPPGLLPNHGNIASETRPFEDRFRVQIATKPSTTVVSHISKDGHYYIHPDPDQMRSLTVREAARLQSFPDNYFFMGNRTQQYHQVGNAVPPLLANQIAKVVASLLTGKREVL
jgi:DNA (cytosine-5)-methyltransferase 1